MGGDEIPPLSCTAMPFTCAQPVMAHCGIAELTANRPRNPWIIALGLFSPIVVPRFQIHDTLVKPSKDDLASLFLAQSSRQRDNGYSCSQV